MTDVTMKEIDISETALGKITDMAELHLTEDADCIRAFIWDENQVPYSRKAESSAAGRNAYFIPNSSTSDSEGYTKYARVLNFYIDDEAFCDNNEFEKTELEIEYKDAGYEHFYITYDSHDGEKVYTDYIELYDSNEIKTAVITLDDARFSKGCNVGTESAKENKNCDFTLTVPRRSGGSLRKYCIRYEYTALSAGNR